MKLIDRRRGDPFLSRFSPAYEKTLNDTLKTLGMEIDQNQADFFEMVTWEGKPRLYMSEVKHKACLELDEKGTKATGATPVEMKLTNAPAFQFTMEVDRPFPFLIEEKKLLHFFLWGLFPHRSDTDGIE